MLCFWPPWDRPSPTLDRSRALYSHHAKAEMSDSCRKFRKLAIVPKSRSVKVLEGVLKGKTKVQACMDAGYSESYALARSGKVVAAAMEEMPQVVVNRQSIGEKALGKLNDLLDSMPGDKKLWPPILRLAFEYAGEMGPNNVQNNFFFPPMAQKMIEDKAAKILAGMREVTIRGELSEGA